MANGCVKVDIREKLKHLHCSLLFNIEALPEVPSLKPFLRRLVGKFLA